MESNKVKEYDWRAEVDDVMRMERLGECIGSNGSGMKKGDEKEDDDDDES